MEKFRVNIIDNSEKIQNSLKSDLEEKVRLATGIESDVRLYYTCPDDIEELRGGHLNFIDYYLPNGLTGDIVARRLIDAGIPAPRVLLGGRESWSEQEKEKSWRLFRFGSGNKPKPEESVSEDEFFRRVKDWTREGLFQDIMIKPFEENESSDVVQHLIERDLIINPISIGCKGLGRLGLDTIKRSVEQPWIKSVDVYSPYFNENDRQTYHEHREVINSDKLNGFHSSDASLLETNPDVLIIATGVRYPNGKIPTRIEEFENTSQKVYDIFKEAIRANYNNMIICGSNPFEVHMRVGYKMGLNPFKLAGESVTDSIRTRKLAARGLVKGPYLDKKIENPNDIDIQVIGSHDQPIPLFSTATINGKPLREYGDYTKFRDRFTMWLRGMGKRVMRGADKIGTYSDAPQGFLEMLSDITHMKKRPKSCWTIYNPADDYFTSMPVNIEYPSLKIHSQGLPELDSWERDQLEKQKNKNIRLQDRISENFFKRTDEYEKVLINA